MDVFVKKQVQVIVMAILTMGIATSMKATTEIGLMQELRVRVGGGTLVSVADSAEHTFVQSLMGGNHYRAWIGLTNFSGAESCED